ncbi:GntP family permease [Rossellomorea aquimaris]|uniref:GntP family permease n=1 Tax=Rossellomorea aquimaris TaxID=189382 RepID=UPI001CD402DF|nr:gluconate:H+ symporter [Rossellomorea aquimaris]MCA1061810.1 GntP family permease [Rossellomorea aquimaris]
MSTSIPIIVALSGIFALLYLVIRTKLHAFVALLLVSLLVGIGAGMPLQNVLISIQIGLGSTLGFVAVIVGLGAMFGQMLEVSGGAEKIASSLIKRYGEKKAPLALSLTGFLIAIPVFFDVGFILLVPIIYGLARRSGRSLLYYGIPLLAGLAVTHSFIPPTPGPVAVAELIGADIGWVILFGTLAGIPAMIIAGPLFGKFISNRIHISIPEYMNSEERDSEDHDQDSPSLKVLIGIILVPLFLILLNTLSSLLLPQDLAIYHLLTFIGHPIVALLIATLLSFYFLGVRLGYSRQEVQFIANKALEPAGIIILVTGAGGVFKQVLMDSGVGNELAGLMIASSLPSLLLAFLIAAIVRIAQGSATVAMITTASLLAPLISDLGYTGPQLGLFVIAIASGSTILSHVNDSGFWLVNRYLGMDVKDTLRSWTIMETLIALVGFSVVLLLSLFMM